MKYLAAHWSSAWAVWVLCAAVAAAHLAGLRHMTAARRPAGRAAESRPGAGSLVRETAAFYAGLVTAAAAIASPIGYWSGIYIWVRSMQDLLLAVVAPSLIVLGAPWAVLAAGAGWRSRRPAGERAEPRNQPPPAGRRTAWRLASPTGVAVAFTIIWLGWHVPALYDLAVTSAVARYAEYAVYLGAGIAFWLQLIGSRPSSPAAPPLRRLKLLIGVVVADTILGMVLVFGSALLYPAYGGSAHHVLSVIADQQVGGAVLWMGILPPFIIAVVALLHTWLENEESDEFTRELDRLTRRRAAGWASGKGLGAGAWPSRSGHRRPTI
jgi:putative membrane protein